MALPDYKPLYVYVTIIFAATISIYNLIHVCTLFLLIN